MAVDETGNVDALRRQRADATRRAEILQRVIESIGSGLALGPLLTRIVESGVDLVGASYGSIGLVTEARYPTTCTHRATTLPSHGCCASSR